MKIGKMTLKHELIIKYNNKKKPIGVLVHYKTLKINRHQMTMMSLKK
jgi:hypothetical protein